MSLVFNTATKSFVVKVVGEKYREKEKTRFPTRNVLKTSLSLKNIRVVDETVSELTIERHVFPKDFCIASYGGGVGVKGVLQSHLIYIVSRSS